MQEQENKIKSLCIRFNLSKDSDSEVWNILHSLDKKKWKSYSRAVITAAKDFFNRLSRSENDPYLETREREDKFTADIVAAVERAMDKEIPKYLSVCIGEILRHYPCGSVIAPAAPAVSVKQENNNEVIGEKQDVPDIDLDFMGG